MTDTVHKQQSYHVKIYVVKNCSNNLLSGPTASAMGLVLCPGEERNRVLSIFVEQLLMWVTCGAAL